MDSRKRIKVMARKYQGDDKYSWAVFRSDRSTPVVTGLGRTEVPYYKSVVQREIDAEAVRNNR